MSSLLSSPPYVQMADEEVSILGSQDQKVVDMPSVSEREDVILITQQSPCCSLSSFSEQGNSSPEPKQKLSSATKLFVLIIFSTLVMAVEIVGGVKANSLAILTDAAHLLSDVAGFSISLFAIWASSWNATSRQSFGYSRLEVLGALFSVQLIWLTSGFLTYEAIGRILRKSSKINGALMFGIAAFGFIINLIMVLWLGHDHAHHACGAEHHDHAHHDHTHHMHGSEHHAPAHAHHVCGGEHHDHNHVYERELSCLPGEEEEANLMSNNSTTQKMLNINLQGAYLHIISDLIQSIGVMIAGAIIWAKPRWLVVDLACTLIFSAFALSTTLPMLRDIFTILMERTPKEINVDLLEHGLNQIEGVQSVHDLHVWAITLGKTVLSCHVISKPGVNSNQLLRKIQEFCERRHKVRHITIQIEQQLSSKEVL